MNGPYWFELAVVLGIFAVGGIWFGHFEEGTPRWRRLLKVVLVSGAAVGLSALGGRGWFFGWLGLMAGAAVVIHGWWLPRQGVNGWTGEPRRRYYQLRGWTWRGDAGRGRPS